ncbi:MAG: hypothetical protein SGPRY_013423 [Prymnesium sp.]
MAASSIYMFSRFSIDHTVRFGEGGYGATFAAFDHQSEESIVVKVIDTRKMRMELVRKECKFLETCQGHENIIALKAHGPGQNKHALAQALAHCHRHGVAHRDIKLENALLTEQGLVKLIDFGLSHLYFIDPATGQADRSVPITGYCGSKSYAAPEVLTGRGYDGYSADIWSLGVCMFGLLNGFFPVDEAKPTDWRFQKLCRSQELGKSSVTTILAWYKKTPSHLSPKAIALIDQMLNIDPVKRPSIEDVLRHPFLTGDTFPLAVDAYDTDSRYRGAAYLPHAAALEMDIHDEGPVYRAISHVMLEEQDDDLAEMPGLTRQAAFGGSLCIDELFVP